MYQCIAVETDFLPLSTTIHGDNTFLAILYQLRSVLHESTILERKTALHGKLVTEFIKKVSSNPHQFIFEF